MAGSCGACGTAASVVLVPRLIPELICSDLGSSLAFYRLLGFTINYSRRQERFVYAEGLEFRRISTESG